MTATTRNRIAPYLDVLPPPAPPATPAERREAYADAVHAAVLALKQQLANPDAAVVRRAATLLLDLEKTRMRHHTGLPGTADELPPLECRPHTPDEDDPLAEREEHDPEPTPEEVEEARAGLQRRADREGRNLIVTTEQAVNAWRELRHDIATGEFVPQTGIDHTSNTVSQLIVPVAHPGLVPQ